MHFEGNEEAPAELALGEGGKENNSAGSCQLSTEMKGEDLQSMPSLLLLCLIYDLDSEVSYIFYKAVHNVIQI